MKKFVAAILMFGIIAGIVSAQAAKPVAIDFWYSMGGANGDLIQSMVKDFNEKNKDVMVTATYQGNYYDTSAKIQAAVASGTTPHVSMVVDMHNAMFADAEVLENMEPFMKKR
jgi:sn-glycerol 3-phosphate transport system substrate-binding protein